MSWPQIKKSHHFKILLSFILSNNNEPFLYRIMRCNKRWFLYNNQWWPAQWLDWGEAPKSFPKPNLPLKNVMVTVWWSAAHIIHDSFLDPGETITSEKCAQQIDAIHGTLRCLQLALVNRMGPGLLQDSAWPHVTQPALQKLNKLGYKVLPYPSYLPDLLPTDYCFFKHHNNFLLGKRSHSQQGAENASCEAWFFYAAGINLSLVGKNVLIVML